MRGPLHKYPDRKRCYSCRSYFGFVIVDGLYDSYECAGRKAPDAKPELWPREHFSWSRDGQKRRVRKRSWASGRSAEKQARKYGKIVYVCCWCGGWHIGSLRPESAS